ncbi:MAG: diguanylate cyclase [Desulfobacterium sp.]|nr:diguanylate cyclase [Desulfobacterium sp.]
MSNKNNTILIIDDSKTNIGTLSAVLELHGFKTITARSGKMGIQRAIYAKPDLILLDIMMPGLDGFETCCLLKADDGAKNIPVIFMTALADMESKLQAFDAGGVDYITKPFEEAEVLARVKTHLTIGRLQQELEARNRELAALVHIDGLTRIANRRHFDRYINQEWKKMRREKGCMALIFIDIDYFKQYNDYYGHQAGDECLKQVARLFDNAGQRPADLAARYGGEEFVILLPNTDNTGAKHIAKSIQTSLQELQIPHARSTVSSRLTCSMGIAWCKVSDQVFSVEIFIGMADAALYRAKTQGRNKFIISDKN